MAEKILKIKLEVDTSGGAKLVKVTKEYEDAIKSSGDKLNLLRSIEQERAALLNTQQIAYNKLATTVSNANALIEKSGSNSGLAFYNADRAAKAYQQTLDSLIGRLAALQAKETERSSNIAPQARAVAEGSGVADQRREDLLKARKEREANIIANFNAATERIEREAADRRVFNTQSETNSRTIMYARMFDEIAAREQAAITRSQTFAQRMASVPRVGQQGSQTDITGTLTRHLQQQTAAQEAQNRAVSDAIPRHRSLSAHIFEIIGLYRIWNSVINTVLNSIRAIPRVGIELDSTKASLLSTIGSAAGMGSALEALDKEAERTGISITVLRENFRGFQASTSLAGASIESTWKMFTNLNTVITGLHLSADKANGIFLAMAQIFNKGKVQSEELVKQLGNLLPGAFASFAASMNVLPSKLSAMMKAGLVTAQDTVEGFTTFMKDRFAIAFGAASQNLNANVGRMQTSFVHLGETIYDTSSGAMNEIVKAMTRIVDGITSLINGTNRFSSILNTVLKVAILASLAALINYITQLRITGTTALATQVSIGSLITTMTVGEAATIAMSTAMKGLRVAMAFLASPGVIIAGLAYIATEIYKVNAAADTTRETFKNMRKEALDLIEAETNPTLRLDIEVDKSPAVQQVKKLLEDATLDLNRAIVSASAIKDATPFGMPSLGNSEEEAQKDVARKQQQLDNIKLFYKKTREAEKANIELAKQNGQVAVTNTENLNKAKENADIAAMAHGKNVREVAAFEELKFMKQHASDIATAQSLIDKAKKPNATQVDKDNAKEGAQVLAQFEIAKIREVQDAVDRFNSSNAAQAKRQSSSIAKEVKADLTDAYKEIAGVIKLEAAETQTSLDKIDESYSKSLISINKYFKEKQSIQLQSIENQKAFQNQIIEQATVGGDTPKIEEARVQINILNEKAAQIVPIIAKEQNDALIDYNKTLQETHATYLELIGDIKGAEEAKLKEQEAKKVRGFTANLNDPDKELAANSARALQEETVLQKNAGLQRVINDLNMQRNSLNTIYDAQLNKIHILVQVGSLSELNAAYAIREINAAKIKQLEEVVKLEEQAIAVATRDHDFVLATKIKSQVAAARSELENLRAEGDAFVNFVTTKFASAFDNAFAGFVSGSLTAQEAFKSFATSIVSEIAKILAQEIRVAAVKGVISMFTSSASTSSIASNYGVTSGSFSALANGGVMSGPGISAHSGTVVSSPTVFPFARGIGLMGEAGAEAILPLKRGKDGKLGVSSENTGQSNGNVYNITVAVTSGKDDKPSDTGDKVAQAIIRAIAKEEITKAARPGNSLNRTTAFG